MFCWYVFKISIKTCNAIEAKQIHTCQNRATAHQNRLFKITYSNQSISFVDYANIQIEEVRCKFEWQLKGLLPAGVIFLKAITTAPNQSIKGQSAWMSSRPTSFRPNRIRNLGLRSAEEIRRFRSNSFTDLHSRPTVYHTIRPCMFKNNVSISCHGIYYYFSLQLLFHIWVTSGAVVV